MHYVNMEDGNHENYASKFDVKMAVKDNQKTVSEDSQTVSETVSEDSQTDSQTVSDGGSYSLPEFETVDRGGSNKQQTESSGCCESPDLDGAAGDMFRLDNGDVIRLDGGEQICMNCEDIHK